MPHQGEQQQSLMSEAPDAPGLSGLEQFGLVMGVFGVLQQAIGSYYSAQSQRYALKSQALDLEFQKSMAAINQRAAEGDAQLELEAGKQEAGRVGLQYRQIKQGARTRQAAAGVQAGVGSAAEELASIEFAKEADRISINANAVRAANAARMRAVGFGIQGRMAGAGAQTLRGAAGGISPFFAAGTSLLGGAGMVAREWAASQRQSARYRQRGGE